jgi:hypothetical protein
MFQEREDILPGQETDGKLKAKQEDFLLSELKMTTTTMIAPCGILYGRKVEGLFIRTSLGTEMKGLRFSCAVYGVNLSAT